ncbi:hypothetical protein J6O86_05385 [bacterium]|nr:hypothetical protein [bacterium]
MKTHNVSVQSFNGGLFVVNKLSKKPVQCLEKEKSNILALIKKENFDLFFKQDYSNNDISITATTLSESNIQVTNFLPVTARHSEYLKASEKTVKDYKKAKDDYIYSEYKKNRTFKQKFFDFLNNVLYDIVWS